MSTVASSCVDNLVDDLLSILDPDQLWLKFTENFNKTYSDEDAANEVKNNLLANVAKITKNNEDFKAGSSSFKMGVYPFSDLSHAEVLNDLCGTELPRTTRALPSDDGDKAEEFPAGPDEVDWRKFTLPVADQKVR